MLLVCRIVGQSQTVAASAFYNTTITSPKYPSDYENDLDCSLLIQLDISLLFRGYIVKVIFDDFLLESPGVGHDVLKFYDGMDVFASLLGSYSGTTHPEVIYSTGQYLYVKFHTDSIVTYRGFSFSFSAVKEGTFTVDFNFLEPCKCFCQSVIWTPKHHRPSCS